MVGARLRIDRGIPSDLTRVPATAATLEHRGYDGCWTGEINHDPFLPVLLAAEHTSTLEVGTSIPVAFARNPMTIAHRSDGRMAGSAASRWMVDGWGCLEPVRDWLRRRAGRRRSAMVPMAAMVGHCARSLGTGRRSQGNLGLA